MRSCSVEQSQKPAPHVYLESAEALLSYGDYGTAAKLMDEFSDQYKDAGVSLAIAVRRNILIGEILHVQCRWSEAVEALTWATTVREENGYSDWEYVREDMRAHATLLDIYLATNQPELTAKVVERADTLWKSKPEDLADNVAKARYAYIRARAISGEIIRRCRAAHEVGAMLPDDYDSIINLANTFGHFAWISDDSYRRALKQRRSYDLSRDLLVISALMRDGDKVVYFQREDLYAKATYIAWARSMLAREQLGLLVQPIPADHARLRAHQRGVDKLRVRVTYATHSRILYADYLAVSVIYDRLLESDNTGKRDEVRSIYNEIGRGDRWEAIERAVGALPVNVDMFRQYFSYMLLS